MGYTIIAHGVDRSFEIMLGLREGYGDGRHEPEHTLEDVIQAHHDWQSDNDVVQGIAATPCRLSYGWRDDAGLVNGVSEPACMLTGSINIIYDRALDFAEARARILVLATYMAKRLGQTRVYVRFAGESIVLHADDSSTLTSQ